MYARILVPVDGSLPSECGLQEALRIAGAVKARLVLLNVVNEFPILTDPVALADYNKLLDILRSAGEELVAKASKAAAASGVDCETAVVDASNGHASSAIVAEAASRHCDLIVMGTHGRRGMRRLALGSDAELVVRHASVPVLLVKPPAP
jgi:nucleotide-binding universal stress UspA family protein